MGKDKVDSLYDFIVEFVAENGYAPSYREMCEGVGIKSTETVSRYLGYLRNRGKVVWTEGKSRTLRVVEDGVG